ncbi:MAG: excinuclease ABC subunit UvrC [Candidatus Omnitrophota bacterium]|jgi:excinuclease ABC subunit C
MDHRPAQAKTGVTAQLRLKVGEFPFAPGVYLMRDEAGGILYIGKARSLRKRVLSYFTPRPEFPKLRILMSKVSQIDYLETSTEVDALLLEARLIREHQPPYNKELKDDKSYPLLKITREKFPRIHLTRTRTQQGGGLTYGPFTDAKLLREAIALIHSLFPIRKCRRLPKTACLYYHIGQCLAPCIKPEVKPHYDRVVEEIKSFIGSGKRSFTEYLAERMQEASSQLRFEDAAYFKGQIEAMSRLRRKRFDFRRPESGVLLSATAALKKILGMKKLPEKIVCFDVSHAQGDEAVASRVGFYRELPDKMAYRRYKIKTVFGIDDYAMIREALSRMLTGIREGREDFIPDLIMIDGGKGHWSAAAAVLKQESFEGLDLIALAKKFETVYGSENGKPLPVPRGSPALHLLQKIRDEAHRFAISYHRLLKEKSLTQSILDEIPAIGAKRKRVLLEQFDSIREMARAGVDQLAGLPGMDRPSAEKVWQFLRSKF